MTTVKFSAVAPFRVLVNGAEISRHEQYDDAMQSGYAAAAADLGTLVEVIGGTGLQIVVQAATQPPVDPDPEEPEVPEPETPEEPEEPEEPEGPVEPPPPIDYTGDHPFYAIAAEMQPGEFRRVPVTLPEGVDTMAKMNSTHWYGPDIDPETGKNIGGTFGIGWTDRHIFDEQTGRLCNVLLREQYQTSVTWLNPDLSMDGVLAPDDAGLTRRRPFNRMCQGPDGYIYFAPSLPSDQIGRLTRFHPATPHIWEDAGAPRIPTTSLAGAQSSGDFALSWFPDLGKFVMYTSGIGRGDKSPEGIHDYVAGRVWAWGPGDETWVMVGRTQSCGYAGCSIYNPIRREVLLYGGSNAYSNPHPLGGTCTATLDEHGVLHRHGPNGLFVSAGGRRVGIHPVTGDYMVMEQETRDGARVSQRIWIGVPWAGRPWRLMHQFRIGEVFDAYEVWHRVCELPRTDVLIWSDHRRGIILHKPLRWEDLTEADDRDRILGEDGPHIDDPQSDSSDDEDASAPDQPGESEIPIIDVPSDPLPPPHDGDFPPMMGTALDALAEQCQPGRVLRIYGEFPEGIADWAEYRERRQTAVKPAADMTTWGAKGLYDRVRQTVMYIGDRTSGNDPARMTFHRYNAALGRWDYPSLDMPHALRRVAQAHTYGQQAIDDRRGVVYYGPDPDQINRYRIGEDRWEHIALDPSGVTIGAQSPCIWHEGVDMLLASETGRKGSDETLLYGWRDGMKRFEPVGACGHDSYHSHFHFNRKRGDALMLGGNHNPKRVTLITATGEAVRMKDRPDEVGGVPLLFGVGTRHLTSDPKSGNYLLFDRERIIWEYSPDRDQWEIGNDLRKGSANESDWSGPYHGNVGIPIDGTDYMLWYSYYTPRIYKHVAVL